MKSLAAVLLLSSSLAFAQQGTTAAQAPNADTSYIDADGTAHITRVIPVPPDLSPEAKKSLARQVSDARILRASKSGVTAPTSGKTTPAMSLRSSIPFIVPKARWPAFPSASSRLSPT